MTVKRVVEVGLEFGSLVDNRWLCGNYHALRDEEKEEIGGREGEGRNRVLSTEGQRGGLRRQVRRCVGAGGEVLLGVLRVLTNGLVLGLWYSLGVTRGTPATRTARSPRSVPGLLRGIVLPLSHLFWQGSAPLWAVLLPLVYGSIRGTANYLALPIDSGAT